MSKCLRNREENKRRWIFFLIILYRIFRPWDQPMKKPGMPRCCVNRSCRLLITA